LKKILVTGAGGYIGRNVITKLLDMGADVLAADILVEGIDSRAQTIKTDIFSGSKTIFQELGTPDACLHMAWKDGFVHNSAAHMECLSKHYEFIRNMSAGGLKQIAIMGTMHEIGYYEGAVDENTPCNPISMYGIAKDALRRSTFQMLKDTDVVWQWLRAYYIFGDDKRNHSIFTKIIQAEEEGKTEFPFNSGKNKYDFITVGGLAKMLAACVMQTEIIGIINCCSGKPVSLAEKVEDFLMENNYKIKLKYGAFPDRPYDSPATWGDSTKIDKIMERSVEDSYGTIK
jgi:dTDP-6-deoxy-L-talose 4-dehydrogenase (NAD+)